MQGIPKKSKRLDLLPDQVDALRRLLDRAVVGKWPETTDHVITTVGRRISLTGADWKSLSSIRFALNTPEERRKIEEGGV